MQRRPGKFKRFFTIAAFASAMTFGAFKPQTEAPFFRKSVAQASHAPSFSCSAIDVARASYAPCFSCSAIDFVIQGFIRELEVRGLHDNAVQKLVAIGEYAVPRLINELKNKNRFVRHGSAEALGTIGNPAVSALIGLLKDKDVKVRNSAAIAIELMEDK